MDIVSMKDVGMIYGASRSKEAMTRALQHVSFSFRQGVNYAVTGASGSGKSTMLNIVAGLLIPTEGECVVCGENLSRLSDRKLCELRNKHIGVVVQDFALLEHSTVLENCMFPALLAGMNRKEARNRAFMLAESLGIGDIVKKKVKHLSGGQRQRTAAVRALMNSPKLILADEPTGSLDSAASLAVMKLLLGAKDQGNTLILVTHNPDLANLCDEECVLKDGRIIS